MITYRKVIRVNHIAPSNKPQLNRNISPSKKENYPLQSISKQNDWANQRTVIQLGTSQDRGVNSVPTALEELTSSYSLDQLENQQQRKLFWQLLQSNNLQWLDIFPQMANQVQGNRLLTFVKIGEDIPSIQSNRNIAHYIAIWLTSMGYSEPQTKKRVLSNVSLAFHQCQKTVYVAELMYDSLLHQYLPPQIQLKALLQICKRGWQYFSFLICKLIKVLSKLKDKQTVLLYNKLENIVLQ